MDLLLTGASGFLGYILRDSLMLAGLNVISAGRSNCDITINLPSKIDIPISRSFDMVIHAAGKAHSIPKNKEEAAIFYAVNFEGTKNLCKAIEGMHQKPKAFIFISTVAVYGKNKGELISEESPLMADTPYAESKMLSERWLEEWCEENKVKLSILRLPLIVGSNPPGNLLAMINGIKSGKYLSIGEADAKKSMVWAEDIAFLIPQLINVSGIYNLTDGYHPSFGELEHAICDALGKKDPLKIPFWLASKIGRVGDIVGRRFPINSDKLYKITSTLTFDDTKAREIFAWSPTPILKKISQIV